MKLMDMIIEEMNKSLPEGEKVERLHSAQYQICENGAHKDVRTGKFISEEYDGE